MHWTIKAAVQKTQSTTTTNAPIVAVVINENHNGSWSKYYLDGPTSSENLWSNFRVRIGCTSDKEKADKLIKYFAPSKTTK